MDDPKPRWTCNITAIRERRRITQAELGRQAGMTRQAVNLIERGKVVPSVTTALVLAGALGCAVDELFQPSAPPAALEAFLPETLPAGDSRLHLAFLRDRWLGFPLSGQTAGNPEGFSEADALLLSRRNRSASVRPLVPESRLGQNLVIAGCDPALGILRDAWQRAGGEGRVIWRNLPTRSSLQSLLAGEAHVAGIHFPDPAAEKKMLEALPMKVVVFRFADWEQGWMVRRGNPLGFGGVENLSSRGVRFINRPAGSGTRLLLEGLMKKAGMAPRDIPAWREEAATHFASARAVHDDRADVAFGLRAVAAFNDLDFIAAGEVAFNLVIPIDLIDLPPVGRLLDLLQNRSFQRQLDGLPGYETRGTGTRLS